MSWVQSIILFFSYLAWALYGVGLVVACFECAVEYQSGRGSIRDTALNAIKGFMAVGLFTTVPVELYKLSVSLQGSFTAGITGLDTNIGTAASNIIDTLKATGGIDQAMSSNMFGGLTSITSTFMMIFILILMGYAVFVLTSHQLRHNGITDRLAAGFTPEQIRFMTAHHGDAMIYKAYNHLDLLPAVITEKQRYVLDEPDSINEPKVLFGGRILNMEEQLEKRLLKNIRAHRVPGGVCSDITGCKSDMFFCLDCDHFVPDADQLDYFIAQADSWARKAECFKEFPLIKSNAEKNARFFRAVADKIINVRGGMHNE